MNHTHPDSPFAKGSQAYLDGVDPQNGNPFDADEFPDEWDEWVDGWATARLTRYLPWHEEVRAKIGQHVHYVGDFNKYFDEGMSPEEAIAENKIEAEKHDAQLDDQN